MTRRRRHVNDGRPTDAALVEELKRIASSDPELNELAFVPPWKSLKDLLGEDDATVVTGDDDDDGIFYHSFCVREHKLAINVNVLVPILSFIYAQMRRGSDDGDLKVLLCVLTGDSLSGWNVRKRRVCQELEDVVMCENEEEKQKMKDRVLERELTFVAFIQTKFPKSTAAFAHRRWVILKCCSRFVGRRRIHPTAKTTLVEEDDGGDDGGDDDDDDDDDDAKMLKLCERESLACEQTCRRKPSNYAAWAHKLFVFELVHLKQNVNKSHLLLERAKNVLRESKTTISASDPSAWHFRRAVIRLVGDRLFHFNDEYKKRFSEEIIEEEFRFVREKIVAFRGRETLWHHRKTLLVHVLQCFDGQLLAQNEIIKEEIEFAKENNSADEVKVRDVPWATKYEDGDEVRLRLSFSKYVCRILVARQYP